ncbi:hypothetical protein [Neomegalonema sp.]|uniref:hypothetical protein n=1 Tax=Neomegalonema sp. TaxID=2039713 RepID=UPI0026027ADE|nr:hypothetical protein [Neomegalonema sp.]MDD2868616.1 hypothetical protein [Neomegalonema sp.]
MRRLSLAFSLLAALPAAAQDHGSFGGQGARAEIQALRSPQAGLLLAPEGFDPHGAQGGPQVGPPPVYGGVPVGRPPEAELYEQMFQACLARAFGAFDRAICQRERDAARNARLLRSSR